MYIETNNMYTKQQHFYKKNTTKHIQKTYQNQKRKQLMYTEANNIYTKQQHLNETRQQIYKHKKT